MPTRREMLFALAASAPLSAAIAPNPIVAENRKPGTTRWRIRNLALRHEIEGYPSIDSVEAGGSLGLHVRSHTRAWTLEIFRLGWYGGYGGRSVLGPIRLSNGEPAPLPRNDLNHPLRCAWPGSYQLEVPREWTSGFYWALLTSSSGHQSAIPFIVREAAPSAHVLLQIPVTTYHAYNNWGGRSLYDFQSPGGRAFRVSFERPYSPASLTGDRGFFYCDFALVRWMESQGYSVAYCTNLDIHRQPALASQHQVFLSCGHDEYWSTQMMDHVEAARAKGTHLLFLSADTCHWVIRMEENGLTEACYKNGDLDPLKPATVRFRDPEIGRPEVQLMGVQNELHCVTPGSVGYGPDGKPARYMVKDPSHFLFRGTGLTAKDGFEAIVGFEWDSVYPGGPKVDVLLECADIQATCRYEDSQEGTMPAQAVAFEHESRGGVRSRVFSSGTIRWSWGLDDFQFDGDKSRSRVDGRLAQFTANILSWMGTQPATPAPSLSLNDFSKPVKE